MYATLIPAGTLTIRAASDDSMSCELWLNDDFVGSFPSADAAAQSVSHHSSGCVLIDNSGAELPQSIDSWQWISVSQNAANQPIFLMKGGMSTV
jgi:murein endopeptidase